MITIDTLRADHLGFHGYPRDTSPNLDGLAEQSVVFERAIAQWPKTGPSFASIFTGRYPQSTGLTHKAALRVPEAYLTLPELFHEKGFTTVAVVSNGVLGKRLGWDAGFDAYEQTWDLAPHQSDVPEEYRRWINAERVNQLAAPLLEKHQDAERLFAWIHYSDPHAPYVLPSGEENPFLGDEHDTQDGEVVLDNPRATRLGDETRLGAYVAAYDANVRVADRHIGNLLGFARELGLLDDTLVVVTADHGESLGEHDYYFGHGRLPHNPGSHVPLLFSYPEHLEGGRRIAEPVELVDLYPTLHAWLAADLPDPGLEGESLLGRLFPDSADEEANEQDRRRPSEPVAYSSAGGGNPLTHWRSVQGARYKWIFHPQMPVGDVMRPQIFELYDLEADPGETRDLAAAEPDAEARRLRRMLYEWMNGDWITRDSTEVEAESEEMLKTLRALGYVQ